MSLRHYVAIMMFATAFCWSAWVLVILNVNPLEATFLEFFFFYVSLFLSLLGTISLLLFGGFFIFGRAELSLYRSVKKSFLYGSIIACIGVLLLYLQSLEYLHYWNLVILGTLALFLILFRFSTRRKRTLLEN